MVKCKGYETPTIRLLVFTEDVVTFSLPGEDEGELPVQPFA